MPAALGVVALVVGSSGYLLNLLARGAVVASGAVGQQVAVEEWRGWRRRTRAVTARTSRAVAGTGAVLAALVVPRRPTG